jgi:hypothetical protein
MSFFCITISYRVFGTGVGQVTPGAFFPLKDAEVEASMPSGFRAAQQISDFSGFVDT